MDDDTLHEYADRYMEAHRVGSARERYTTSWPRRAPTASALPI